MHILHNSVAQNKCAYYTTLLQPFYGPLSGTTWVSQYQKKHSPIPLSWSSSKIYQLLPSTMIHSFLPVQFTCLTIFSHNLAPSPLWSTWSGALHLIFHTFLQPNSVFFFATRANTIAACVAVVPRLYHLFLVYSYCTMMIIIIKMMSHVLF